MGFADPFLKWVSCRLSMIRDGSDFGGEGY